MSHQQHALVPQFHGLEQALSGHGNVLVADAVLVVEARDVHVEQRPAVPHLIRSLAASSAPTLWGFYVGCSHTLQEGSDSRNLEEKERSH